MSKFLTGKELNDAIYDIIWKAEEELIIVSPFIRLDDYFKEIFTHHKHNHKLHIIIVFGKNEGSPKKSLCREDFEFFKQFRNITIIYCSNLHAKYYSNETEGILTSINFYDSSFKNNIEYGAFFSADGVINSLTNGVDKEALAFTYELMEKNPAVFIKRPVYEKTLLGSLLGQKSFIDSEVLHDQTEQMLRSWYNWEKEPKKYIQDFPTDKKSIDKDSKRPERIEEDNDDRQKKQNHYNSSDRNEKMGYCIRTGVPIPYNYKKPMCEEAYKTWLKFKNPNYPEKYCHQTGKLSYGKTSMNNPIL